MAKARKDVSETGAGCNQQLLGFSVISQPPMFTLMHMAARNGVATKYLAIEENFLLTAIHISALKNIPFSEGVLPDLPADIPFPANWV